MSGQENDSSGKPQRDWVDIGLKAFTPIVAGLLIAWAGYVSNYTLSSIANNQQSARLITELQISREQAESELRKDVFDQALQAFLLKESSYDGSLFSMSKQLLRLELLALNFGDSLSLSPLFTEFSEDLKRLKPKENEIPNFDETLGELRKRLYSLARRVSSAQVSSLSQHGVSKEITVPLVGYNKPTITPCATLLYEDAYVWPDRRLQKDFGILDDNNKQLMNEAELVDLFADPEAKQGYLDVLNENRIITLDGIARILEVRISDVDHCSKSAKVSVFIGPQQGSEVKSHTLSHELLEAPVSSMSDLGNIANEGFEPEVSRSFNLNYFNFPMVDNTRLENNHRFAIVLDEYDLKSDEPYIKLIALIFPSEYASLRDRPGMQEARNLLEQAMKDRDEEQD